MNSSVSLQHISKIYNQVSGGNDLSLAMQSGEIFGLLGPHGAVKSTTIRMMTTLTQPSQGDIQIAGLDIEQSQQT